MKILFATIGIFLSFAGIAQKDLNIDYKLRGHIYAGSSLVDTNALGGFAGSDNIPKGLTPQNDFKETGFFLKIDISKTTTIQEKFNGCKLFIVNKSDSIVHLIASDSRLSVIAQAFIDNTWQDIEYLPGSWCGNSYHVVAIKPNEYWEFDVPKFTGQIKTKIRYRLSFGRGDRYLYSNEIVAGVNKNQISLKQGHQPQGLMDPYND